MLDPRAWPGAAGPVELRETHASWIALVGPHAYKLKRPVRHPFLDYSTLALRRAACELELALNARWAPGLYLDLWAAHAAGGGGVRFAPAGDVPTGAALEYAVRMRRFAPDAELPALLARGAVDADDLARFGADVAGWQAAGPAAAREAPYGRPADALATALANLDGLDDAAELAAWTRRHHATLAPALAARRAAGRVRECHGDLHARNVIREEGRLVAFDGIDFDPALRWIDVASDVAFLSMDLERHGRADLAHAFLSAWMEAAGDHHAPVVLRWYAAYRALVRAKVARLRAAEGEPGAGDEAAAYVRVARAQAAARGTRLVLTVGVSGSGKSVLARALAAALPALVLRADVVRKRLAGLPPGAASGSPRDGGLYSAAATRRTYATLRVAAARALRGGWDVIVDATALDPAERAGFAALALRLGVGHAWLECTAPPDVLRARVAGRRGDASEATLAVLASQLARAAPLAPAETARAVTVDTARAFDVAAVAAALRSAAAPPGACSPASAPGS